MKFNTLLFSACVAALASGCATALNTSPQAEAKLEPRSGSNVSGVVSFYANGDKVRVEANVSGLTPGQHGFHIHESGDCSAPDAASAKGHFNPGAGLHGSQDSSARHAGDMPNLVSDASGNAKYQADVSMISLGNDGQGIVGRSVVIHADPDDYKSQPAGNSGKRIACGTIKAR